MKNRATTGGTTEHTREQPRTTENQQDKQSEKDRRNDEDKQNQKHTEAHQPDALPIYQFVNLPVWENAPKWRIQRRAAR